MSSSFHAGSNSVHCGESMKGLDPGDVSPAASILSSGFKQTEKASERVPRTPTRPRLEYQMNCGVWIAGVVFTSASACSPPVNQKLSVGKPDSKT